MSNQYSDYCSRCSLLDELKIPDVSISVIVVIKTFVIIAALFHRQNLELWGPLHSAWGHEQSEHQARFDSDQRPTSESITWWRLMVPEMCSSCESSAKAMWPELSPCVISMNPAKAWGKTYSVTPLVANRIRQWWLPQSARLLWWLNALRRHLVNSC